MAVTLKALARAAFATSSGTLYTVPASTTAVVTDIQVHNAGGSDRTFTLVFNSVAMFTTAPIEAGATASFTMRQVLATAQTITGLASSTDVKVHISGAEVT